MLYTDTEIGNIIRQKRTDAGLTQTELGAKLGVGKTAVAKWEAGKVKNLKRESLQQLGDILGVSPLTLLGFKQEETTEEDARTKYLKDEWDKLFGTANFTDEEFFEIANYAKYVLSKRP